MKELEDDKILDDKDLIGEDKKLTDWKNEPTIRDLKEDYLNAKSAHDAQVTKIDNWVDALNITGAHKINCRKNKSSVQPQLIKKQAEWRYSALSEPFLSSPKLFQVNPVSWEDRKASQQNALVLNNQFDTKINRVKFIDDYVRASVDEGTAIIRNAWSFQEGDVEEEVPTFSYQEMPMNEEIMQRIQELQGLKETQPDSFSTLDDESKETLRIYEESGKIVAAQVTGTKKRTRKKTIINQPDITICDYKDVIPDPTCEGDIRKANFVIYKFESSYAELKATGMYEDLKELLDDNKDKDDGSILALDDSKVTDPDTSANFTFGDNSRKKFTVYEYWGFWDTEGEGDLTPIVATWVNNTLIRMEENPFPDGEVPFIFVPFLPVKGSLYGEPNGALIEDHQKIVGAVTRGVIDLLALSANSQMAMPKGVLDGVNKRKFLNGEAYEYNPSMGINPQNAIFSHKYPELPNSALQVIQMMSTDADSLTGVKSFSTGGGITGGSLGDTAAGVRGALDAASKREMGILRRLASGVTQVGRKIVSMNSEFLEEEEIVRITNETFVPVRKDDLQGNFDLKLTIATAEVDNAKAQELAFMLQTMGNTLPPEQSNIILAEIARLRNMPDLAKQIEDYKPEPDPMQEQLQQLEMQKLEAEIQLLQAQAAEAGAKSQVQGAKVAVEQARAEDMGSNAAKKSLDFMNEQDGTKHERELEKERVKHQGTIENTIAAKEADLKKEMAKGMMNDLQSLGQPTGTGI